MFREDHPEAKKAVQTWLPAGKRLSLKAVVGTSKPLETKYWQEVKLYLNCLQKNSFCLYTYSLK